MKPSEMIGMSDEQLGLTLGDTEKHLFHLRFQSATDRLETPSEIRKAKQDIARLQTEQRRREIAKLAKTPTGDLEKLAIDLAAKTEGPGKRRHKRALARVNALQAQLPAQPAKGK